MGSNRKGWILSARFQSHDKVIQQYTIEKEKQFFKVNPVFIRILIDHKEIKALCRRYYQPNVELMIGEETCNIEQSPIHIFKENGYKIFESVKIALDCIEDFTSVASGLNDIGYSLYNFGTQIEHIDIVVEALLSTLQAVLQDEYTKKCKAIWSKILEIIALEIKIGLSNAENKL